MSEKISYKFFVDRQGKLRRFRIVEKKYKTDYTPEVFRDLQERRELYEKNKHNIHQYYENILTKFANESKHRQFKENLRKYQSEIQKWTQDNDSKDAYVSKNTLHAYRNNFKRQYERWAIQNESWIPETNTEQRENKLPLSRPSFRQKEQKQKDRKKYPQQKYVPRKEEPLAIINPDRWVEHMKKLSYFICKILTDGFHQEFTSQELRKIIDVQDTFVQIIQDEKKVNSWEDIISDETNREIINFAIECIYRHKAHVFLHRYRYQKGLDREDERKIKSIHHKYLTKYRIKHGHSHLAYMKKMMRTVNLLIKKVANGTGANINEKLLRKAIIFSSFFPQYKLDYREPKHVRFILEDLEQISAFMERSYKHKPCWMILQN